MLKEKKKKIINKFFSNKIPNFLRKLVKFLKKHFVLLVYQLKIRRFKSDKYWINRYKKGGNSGRGSYGLLSRFKAEVINNFVRKNDINSVIEFGCGDGNQLKYFNFPRYLGFDISPEIISLCKNKFNQDCSKNFILMNEYKNQKAELTLSLDVIFHLIEKGVFDNYMERLFNSSEKFVIIYSSNEDKKKKVLHVKHRKFSKWIDKNKPDWVLFNYIPNRYPENAISEGSFADFYFYKKL